MVFPYGSMTINKCRRNIRFRQESPMNAETSLMRNQDSHIVSNISLQVAF